MSNFINPEVLTAALHTHLNAQGELSVIRKIKTAQRRPLSGDPVALAKGMKPSRVQNPNADDFVEKDEDEDDDDDLDEDMDACANDTERADLKVRRKARADADRKKRSNADAALKMIKG